MNASLGRTIRTIGVFDSGVGGLSILAALRRSLPQCHFIYMYDQAFFPYGLKSEAALTARLEQLCTRVVQRYPLDAVVIACNTASTAVLPALRRLLALPVVGVVPAIKPAAQISRSKVLGLLATPGTISRSYTQELITTFAPDCQVISLASNRLVELAEDKLRGIAVDQQEIAAILAPLSQHPQLDTLVLACTHFPLLAAEIERCFTRPISLVEPSEAIARRLHSVLAELPAQHRQQPSVEGDLLLVTKAPLPKDLVTSFGFCSQAVFQLKD